MPTVPEGTEDSPFKRFAAAVRAVSRAVDDAEGGPLTRGDVASLRREDGARSPVFYKLASMMLRDVLPRGGEAQLSEAERRWARVVHLLARTAGQHVVRGPKFGAALADAGLAEARFVRLLRAEGDAIDPASRAAIAPLVQQALSFDALDLAALIVSAPHPTFRFHLEDGDDVRRRVARDFYRVRATQD
ncbi:MAG: type I-E CRISPR-associated protein Cse2/CasB [Sandaracinaceae bacterium]|nr:type I-E CRISPR-associated protein Cse2/CasB [Sandaracinaceae bacterium]